MAVDIVIGGIASSIKADSEKISFEFGTQSVPLPSGGIRLNNARAPTSTISTETILAFANTNLSGYQFNHITDTSGGVGIFKLQSFVNTTITDVFQFGSDNVSFTNVTATDTIYGNSPALIGMLHVTSSQPSTTITDNNWTTLVDNYDVAYSHKATFSGNSLTYTGDQGTAVLFNIYMQFVDPQPFDSGRTVQFALAKNGTVLNDTISNRVSVNPFTLTTYVVLAPSDVITICARVASGGSLPYNLTMYSSKLVMQNL